MNRRRAILLGALIIAAALGLGRFSGMPRALPVNAPARYPVVLAKKPLLLTVDADVVISSIDHRIFGSNLEWFNHGDGLASHDQALRDRLISLAKHEGITVWRFPGGILADYYHWVDGTGPQGSRPVIHHPTDSGSSSNLFGSPEFFTLLRRTRAQGLITVNAGTGTAKEAAAWVAYANQTDNPRRARDGFAKPIGIKLWEVGNELYLPGNPGEKKIAVTPQVYARRFVRFADAMRKVDPSITVMAIGVAKSHLGPDTRYPDWTKILLRRDADKIDMIAVHNAYFPMLYKVHGQQRRVDRVYPALWAAPEAVDRSLTRLGKLIARYEGRRHIGIAITEWGALYSLPRFDPYWTDHVKTLGSGVYIGRMLQVFMSHPRVQVANYFKFTDRSFMGWVDLYGRPKVPYWVFRLYARNTGDIRVKSSMTSPQTYSVPRLGIMEPESNVPEVTQIVTRNSKTGRIYVNLVNRSMKRQYSVDLKISGCNPAEKGKVLEVAGKEPTANNGPDIPPEWRNKWHKRYEPYSTARLHGIRIRSRPWKAGEPLIIPPFSVMTLVLDTDKSKSWTGH